MIKHCENRSRSEHFYIIFIPKAIHIINLMLIQDYRLERHEAHLWAHEPTISKLPLQPREDPPGALQGLSRHQGSSSVKWLISRSAFLDMVYQILNASFSSIISLDFYSNLLRCIEESSLSSLIS